MILVPIAGLSSSVRKGIKIGIVLLILTTLPLFRAAPQAGNDPDYSGADLPGPYFSDPALMIALDCPDPVDGNCIGPLHFAKLMRDAHLAKSGSKLLALEAKPGANPFNLPEASEIVSSIRQELEDIRFGGGNPPNQLDSNFLTHPDSRIELVGVVNRMDRQFHSFQTESRCGEISAIFRFSYALTRLPVTLNVVFPAEGSGLDCATAAHRWLEMLDKQQQHNTAPGDLARLLMDAKAGPLTHLTGGNIARIEINMQTYRKPASDDPNDFGSEATYLIRVFRWDTKTLKFQPAPLPNEINRSALICAPGDSDAICRVKRDNRARLVAFLQRPVTVAALDNGTLDIPRDFSGLLSKRAVTVSPGGLHRSINQPYWNARSLATGPVKREEVISDAEISAAMDNAKFAGLTLSNIGNSDDFRLRLNDSTCTGCHQTRAIAGFHFPGRERPGTPPSNSVFLAGSPLFYGDQPRRLEVVRKIAQSGAKLGREALENSYSARPSAKFGPGLENTQLIGGWGGNCLISAGSPRSKRDWSCRAGLTCKAIFESSNAPGMGTCVPDGRNEIGDYMQTGRITTTAWGYDKYARMTPIGKPATPTEPEQVFALDGYDERYTTIDVPASLKPPTGNSYYASHQEFYYGLRGDGLAALRKPCIASGDWSACDSKIRDTQTGGFPAGMLRLAECKGLPPEATCGLVASTGFNRCIKRFAGNGWPIETCFDYFTAFAGVRACTASTPCRDDYICVNPALTNPRDQMRDYYAARLARLQDPSSSNPWNKINQNDPYRTTMYGQQLADDAWIERNDTRGVCIPPYFVFQFRSDGHPPLSKPAGMEKMSRPMRDTYEREGEY